MEELQQQIVQLQNQVNELRGLISNSQYSNTIMQNKNVVQASGELRSPNYVTGVSGWAMDSDGNLEAQDGTFRGSISASTITGSTLTTANSGQRVVLTSTLAQFYDNNDILMVETYAYNGTYLIKGKQTTSNIFLDAGATGYVTLGNGGSPKLTWDGADFYPVNPGVNNLGAPANQWNNVYAEEIIAGDVYGVVHAQGGDSGSFTTADSKTVTVTNGIITDIS